MGHGTVRVATFVATLVFLLTTLSWIEGSQRSTGRSPFDAIAPLRFRDDGTFQISIFEDLHFGENAWDSWGPQQDINSAHVLEKVLDAEDADLAVLNGDLITGENTFRENSTAYLDQIVAPLLNRGLPWASTYGNHDSDFNLSREALLEHEQRWPLARTLRMVPDAKAGITNYYLPVYGSDCTAVGALRVGGCRPRLLLWFFDSRGGHYYQRQDSAGHRVGQPDWVDASAVTWFEQTHAALHDTFPPGGNDDPIPSLVFVHIPPRVVQVLQTQSGLGRGIDRHRQPGINDDVPLAAQGRGDEPFMRALASAGAGRGIVAVFSGHDHGDTWCATWNGQLPGMTVAGTGVHLCFGQHSGYGGYGSWTRGGRQIRITEESIVAASLASERPSVETWIRLETGAVVGAVTLNSTYGRDVYPETPNTHSPCSTCDAEKALAKMLNRPGQTTAAQQSPDMSRRQRLQQYFGQLFGTD